MAREKPVQFEIDVSQSPRADGLSKVLFASFDLSWEYLVRAIAIARARVDAAQREKIEIAAEMMASLLAGTRPPARARNAGPLHADWQLQIESHFLLVAIGSVVRIATRWNRETGDHLLAGRLAAFNASHADAVAARDVFEHAEDHVVGEGKSNPRPQPIDWGLPSVRLRSDDPADDVDLLYRNGTPACTGLKAAAVAAMRLAAELGATEARIEERYKRPIYQADLDAAVTRAQGEASDPT